MSILCVSNPNDFSQLPYLSVFMRLRLNVTFWLNHGFDFKNNFWSKHPNNSFFEYFTWKYLINDTLNLKVLDVTHCMSFATDSISNQVSNSRVMG